MRRTGVIAARVKSWIESTASRLEQRCFADSSLLCFVRPEVCLRLSPPPNPYLHPFMRLSRSQLDMPPEVAGVTFLAFGNGAPDVFSSLAALTTSSSDKEAALLVGVGSLLGAGERIEKG